MANILLVDDEKDIVTLIQFVLVKEGHNVRTAPNGLEALKTLGVAPGGAPAELPDLILMDMLMPVMDGHTACLKLSEHAAAGRIPVLVLTAKGTARDTLKDCPNVAGFVDKPFDPKSLRDTVAATAARKG
ncbi:MAG: response regulator [Elusimicrobiota bacterium]|jgi:two-component system alkaline phosphatase synthesis response regulator PhoP